MPPSLEMLPPLGTSSCTHIASSNSENKQPGYKSHAGLGTVLATESGTGTATPATPAEHPPQKLAKLTGLESLRKSRLSGPEQSSTDRLANHHSEGNGNPQYSLLISKHVCEHKPTSTSTSIAESREEDDTTCVSPPTSSPDTLIRGLSLGPDEEQATEVERHAQASSPDSASNQEGGVSGAIFRNDFFEVRSSPLSGLGAFAVKELKYGDCILMERPLLRTTAKGLFSDFENLDEEGKKVYMSLHGFSMKTTAHPVEKILRANSFLVPYGVAVFAVASRLNHGCKPVRNVLFRFSRRREMLMLTVAREKIPAGTELLINYGADPIELYRVWGFRCACGGCRPVSDQDIGIICKETWSS